MQVLPYWNKNVDLDVNGWLPYRKDYYPVSVNALHSELLARIAALAMDMGSEFFFLRSLKSGYVGTFFRENLIDPKRNRRVDFGFSMVFGYSTSMEKVLQRAAEEIPGVQAGLTLCGLWDRFVLVDECKVIAVVSDNPLFDEDRFLSALRDFMDQEVRKQGNLSLSFFAERFGYRRFSIPYETDDITQLSISQVLLDFQMDETRRVVGPAPELDFPNVFALSLGS